MCFCQGSQNLSDSGSDDLALLTNEWPLLLLIRWSNNYVPIRYSSSPEPSCDIEKSLPRLERRNNPTCQTPARDSVIGEAVNQKGGRGMNGGLEAERFGTLISPLGGVSTEGGFVYEKSQEAGVK